MSKRARLLVTVCMLGLTATAQAEPAMWEVRDDNSAIWLFGSVHVLPANVEWRTGLFNAVLADADKVVFETDISPSAVAELGALGLARGIYLDGTLLTDVIDPETEAKLRQFAASYSLQIGPLLAMKPWFAANTIATAALASTGYTAPGVEFLLQPELASDRLHFLETGEEQLAILTGARDDEQVAMLRSTLDDVAIMPKVMGKMLRSWMSGTPEALSDMLAMETIGMDGAFMERLIYARNRNWIAPLKRMLDDNEENLIVVGAGHLAGDGSVLELLEQAGYEVERVQ